MVAPEVRVARSAALRAAFAGTVTYKHMQTVVGWTRGLCVVGGMCCVVLCVVCRALFGLACLFLGTVTILRPSPGPRRREAIAKPPARQQTTSVDRRRIRG